MNERIVKFRCWCPKTKRMFSVEDLGYTDNEITCIEGTNKIGEVCTIWKNEPYELMQFIGLLDKSGREIYEGDVLKWIHPIEDIGVVEYTAGDNFKSFPDACFYYLNVKRLGRCKFQMDDKYEALGNIFENPGLLNNN